MKLKATFFIYGKWTTNDGAYRMRRQLKIVIELPSL